ncbi:MAG: hypothetical protein WAT32_08405, partial [Candidatus Microthrix parvicella]
LRPYVRLPQKGTLIGHRTSASFTLFHQGERRDERIYPPLSVLSLQILVQEPIDCIERLRRG